MNPDEIDIDDLDNDESDDNENVIVESNEIAS
jgi:hypothetical protein